MRREITASRLRSPAVRSRWIFWAEPPTSWTPSQSYPAADALHASDLSSTCLRFQVNGDGRVAVSDVLLVLAAFGIPVRMNGGGCAAVAEDVNGDCAVSVGDLLVTLSAFGMTC